MLVNTELNNGDTAKATCKNVVSLLPACTVVCYMLPSEIILSLNVSLKNFITKLTTSTVSVFVPRVIAIQP